jgi:hypothetical protein
MLRALCPQRLLSSIRPKHSTPTHRELVENMKNDVENVLSRFDKPALDSKEYAYYVDKMIWSTIACLREGNPVRIKTSIEIPEYGVEKRVIIISIDCPHPRSSEG